MKHRLSNELQKELLSVGADPTEIDKLLSIATRLRQFKAPQVITPETIHSRKWNRTLYLYTGIGIVASGLALGVVLIIISQSVLPNSRMYPIQKISDSVAIDIHPEYRGIIMMRRAQQLRILVTSRASSKVVLATLTDYQSEAAVYKSSPSSYAVFENCKANLRQAAQQATTPERQAIDQALNSLESV